MALINVPGPGPAVLRATHGEGRPGRRRPGTWPCYFLRHTAVTMIPDGSVVAPFTSSP